jgi:hypothetical protein
LRYQISGIIAATIIDHNPAWGVHRTIHCRAAVDVDNPRTEIAEYVAATADIDVATRIDISVNNVILPDCDIFSPDASE